MMLLETIVHSSYVLGAKVEHPATFVTNSVTIQNASLALNKKVGTNSKVDSEAKGFFFNVLHSDLYINKHRLLGVLCVLRTSNY